MITFAYQYTNQNLQMDIVSRLKNFINYLNIPVTQFADSCSIPRPTLSQLLNGRNKKVSDELISKIHESYPNLSVLWLMFGEGDMLHDKSMQISERQNGSIFDYIDEDMRDNQLDTPTIDFKNDIAENRSENFTHTAELPSATNTTENNTKNTSPTARNSQAADNRTETIMFQPSEGDAKKKIVNIIVYYSDNSFESFVPRSDR